MWRYLEHTAELLEGVPKGLSGLSSETAEELLMSPWRQFDVTCSVSLPNENEGWHYLKLFTVSLSHYPSISFLRLLFVRSQGSHTNA